MNTSDWIALLGLVVAVLAVAVPAILWKSSRRQAVIDRLEAENRLLRDASIDQRIALARLQPAMEVVNRAFTPLPSAQGEGSAS